MRCWTAKWAYFKVRGLGLTTAAQNQVRVVGEEEVHAPRGLNVVPVDPTLDAIAMVAVYGSTRKIETWSWLSPFNP